MGIVGVIVLLITLLVTSLPLIGMYLSKKSDNGRKLTKFLIANVLLQAIWFFIAYFIVYDHYSDIYDRLGYYIFEFEIGAIISFVLPIFALISLAIKASLGVAMVLASFGYFGIVIFFYEGYIGTYSTDTLDSLSLRVWWVYSTDLASTLWYTSGVILLLASIIYIVTKKFNVFVIINLVTLALFISATTVLISQLSGIDVETLNNNPSVNDRVNGDIISITKNYGIIIKTTLASFGVIAFVVGIATADYFIKEKN